MQKIFTNKSSGGSEQGTKKERYYRINEQIRGATEVRLLNEDGSLLGVFSFEKALSMARTTEVDLIEINRNSMPTLCKLMEYGKFKYLEEKRKKDMRSRQTKIEVKEIIFRPNTSIHDIETKAKMSRRFLDDGDKVKVTVQMKGREILHIDVLEATVAKFLSFIGTHSLETPLTVDGRNAFMIINK